VLSLNSDTISKSKRKRKRVIEEVFDSFESEARAREVKIEVLEREVKEKEAECETLTKKLESVDILSKLEKVQDSDELEEVEKDVKQVNQKFEDVKKRVIRKEGSKA